MSEHIEQQPNLTGIPLLRRLFQITRLFKRSIIGRSMRASGRDYGHMQSIFLFYQQ